MIYVGLEIAHQTNHGEKTVGYSLELVIPAVECSAWNAQLIQGLFGRQMRLIYKLDNLQLLRYRISHASWPHPLHGSALRSNFTRAIVHAFY